MNNENTIVHEDAVGRTAKVIGGTHEGREGRIVGFHIEFGVVILRDRDNFEIFTAHETETEVYV